MTNTRFATLALVCVVALFLGVAAQADIARFVGDYEGSAEVIAADGTATPRDMSVMISQEKEGFTVEWSSITYRSDGRVSDKSYSINFVPSDRSDVYAAAMQRNVFGHEVQLNPMKGQPYVWARIEGDTLSVYSLNVTETGGYEMQQFDRTLVDGGLDLSFARVRNGEIQRTVKTFLARK